MAVRHGYGKVAGTDALVFAYDTGDTKNSYKGEPTENLFGTTNMYFAVDSNAYITTGTDDTGDYFIKDTTNAPWYTGLRIFQNGVRPLYAGVSYVVSFECKSSQYDWSWGLDANASGGGWSGNDLGRASYTNLTFDKTGGTVYTQDMVNTWQRVTYRVTMKDATTFTGADAYPHDSFFPNQNNIKVYYRNPQIEVGRTTATRYTPGERSATQGLLDLTGNATIDLSNVNSYDSQGIVFDGTDDKITMGTNSAWNFGTGNFSIEVVFNMQYNTTYTHFLTFGDQYTFSLKMNRNNIGTNNYRIYAYAGTNGPSTASDIEIDADPPNQYYHLVFVRDGNNAKMYLNGVYKGVKTGWSGASINGASSTMSIGNGWASEYSKGVQPVTKLYNRALTAAEVKNNYNNYKGRFNI